MITGLSGGGGNVTGMTCAAGLLKSASYRWSFSGIIVTVNSGMRAGAPPIDRVVPR